MSEEGSYLMWLRVQLTSLRYGCVHDVLGKQQRGSLPPRRGPQPSHLLVLSSRRRRGSSSAPPAQHQASTGSGVGVRSRSPHPPFSFIPSSSSSSRRSFLLNSECALPLGGRHSIAAAARTFIAHGISPPPRRYR
jgi:hypothetical protein